MKLFAKTLVLSVCVAAVFTFTTAAQDRQRVVKQTGSQPTNLPPATAPTEKVKTTGSSRPVLTNDIKVVRDADPAYEPPLVQKTAMVTPTAASTMAAAGRTAYGRDTSVKLDNAIKSRYGTPYRYGTTGPNTYDCSGFVWSAFQEAGIPFTRASVRTLWAQSEPVEGDERFKFGTLVFLNGLGHMGIVADENGFYHASSSKGIMYSPFKGYWSSRIVGFRKLKPEAPKPAK